VPPIIVIMPPVAVVVPRRHAARYLLCQSEELERTKAQLCRP
jgi:hypothetical protein